MNTLLEVNKTRTRTFNTTIDPLVANHSRKNTSVEIRKQKKDDRLYIRRGMVPAPSTQSPKDLRDIVVKFTGYIKIWIDTGALDIENLKPAEKDILLESARKVRQETISGGSNDFDTMFQFGVHYSCLQILAKDNYPHLLVEAAWILENLAASRKKEHVDALVAAGTVQTLEKFILHRLNLVQVSTISCLRNMAGDDITHCNQLAATPEILSGLLRVLSAPATPKVMSECASCIKNLHRATTGPPVHFTLEACNLLIKYIKIGVMGRVDAGDLVELVHCLKITTEKRHEQVRKLILESGCLTYLVTIVDQYSERDGLLMAACVMSILGELASGSFTDTDIVIKSGVLKVVVKALGCRMKKVRKSTLFMLSNIVAEDRRHIQEVVHCPEVYNKVIELAFRSSYEEKTEALWVLTNIFIQGEVSQIEIIVEAGGLKALCIFLNSPRNMTILCNVLDSIEKILTVSEKHIPGNPFYVTFCAHGLEFLEALQETPNLTVYNKVVAILKLFSRENEENDMPSVTLDASNQFDFGSQSANTFQRIYNFDH